MSTLVVQTRPTEIAGIPFHDLGDPARPPQLALVALPGGGVTGQLVMARLAAYLRRVMAGELAGQALTERTVVVPRVSSAFGIRVEAGTAGQTETLPTVATAAYYRVAVGDCEPELMKVPQVLVTAPNDDERASACLFGLSAVVEQRVSSMVAAWPWVSDSRWHGEQFLLQAGQPAVHQRRDGESLFRALVAFMQRVGALQAPALSETDEDLHYFGPNQGISVGARHPGVFVSMLEVGRWVLRGEVIGHVYDGFNGVLRGEVTAPAGGMLTALRAQALVESGERLAWIHRRLGESV